MAIKTNENIPVAALYSVTACLMFAILGACVKSVSGELGNEQIVFLRNLFGFIFLLPFLFRFSGGVRNLATKRPGLHALRTLAGLGSMYCFFYALGHILLSDAVLLSYTTPLFAPIIAHYWLRERLTRAISLALVTGFVGVGFILKPEGSSFLLVAAWIALLSGFFAAVANTAIRKMSDTEPTIRVVFYYSLGCTIISFPAASLAWQDITTGSWMTLMAAGASATIGQLFLTQAYSHAPVAKIGPFVYFSVIFAAILGWIFWREWPDVSSLLGTALVITAGAIVLRSSRRQKKPETVGTISGYKER